MGYRQAEGVEVRVFMNLVRAGIQATIFVELLVGSAAADAPMTPCGPEIPMMACIPPGEFIRGSSNGHTDERSAEKIYLRAFYMDIYEVTFSEYQECVKAKKCRSARPNYEGFSEKNYPMTGVSWFGADEYCRFKGKRLPTEAEWEKAARTTDGRAFPWGNEPATCERAIIKDAEVNGCGRGKIWPVGSRPPNPYGLYDMAGNSWEWVADWYSHSYQECGNDCRGNNPRGPCGGEPNCPGHDMKIVRGGSWFWPATDATTTRRRPHYPENKPFHHFGFRCATNAAHAKKAPDSLPPKQQISPHPQ
jgi:sulfatase modifying factor 1